MFAHPATLIKALKATDPYIETIFTKGSCYRFHLFLKELFPSAIPVCNADCDHVGSLINGRVYDINGEADWSYRAMSDDEIGEASGWCFADHQLIQIGECELCEEPILVKPNTNTEDK